MRPTPIPDELVTENTQRIVLAPPSRDPTDDHISPLEVLIYPIEIGDVTTIAWVSRWMPTPDELEALNAGRPLELTILGIPQHPAVNINVAPEEEPTP